MAKLHKVELYIIDDDGRFDDIGSIESEIERVLDSTTIFNHKTSEEFDWEDNIKINYSDATQQDYENVLNGKVEYNDG